MVPDYLYSSDLLYHSGGAEPGDMILEIQFQQKKISGWLQTAVLIEGRKVRCFLYAEVQHCIVYSLFIMLSINRP